MVLLLFHASLSDTNNDNFFSCLLPFFISKFFLSFLPFFPSPCRSNRIHLPPPILLFLFPSFPFLPPSLSFPLFPFPSFLSPLSFPFLSFPPLSFPPFLLSFLLLFPFLLPSSRAEHRLQPIGLLNHYPHPITTTLASTPAPTPVTATATAPPSNAFAQAQAQTQTAIRGLTGIDSYPRTTPTTTTPTPLTYARAEQLTLGAIENKLLRILHVPRTSCPKTFSLKVGTAGEGTVRPPPPPFLLCMPSHLYLIIYALSHMHYYICQLTHTLSHAL